jgi:hypothetical protein
MIPVGMGQNDAVHLLNVFAQGGHPAGRFRETLPGVEQDGDPCGL